MVTVAEFPWGSLERIARRDASATTAIATALRARLDPGALAEALARATSGEVRVGPPAPPGRGAPGGGRVHLAAPDGWLHVALEPEPALATLLLARLLGHAPPLTAPGTPLDPRAEGALAAVALAAARATGLALAPSRGPLPGGALTRDLRLTVDGEPYRLRAHAAPGDRTPPSAPGERVALAALGALPLTLPLVAALSTVALRELAGLAPGDLWLPGALLGGRAPGGPARPLLAAPGAAWGLPVSHSGETTLVVGEAPLRLAPGAEDAPPMPSSPDDPPSLEATLLEAPVLVRVEVGAVTLTAREWAGVGPGDVLTLGVRVRDPVTLRVGGRELAQGELVDVDGELGVRITRVAPSDP